MSQEISSKGRERTGTGIQAEKTVTASNPFRTSDTHMKRSFLFAALSIALGLSAIAATPNKTPFADAQMPEATGGVTIDQAFRVPGADGPWKPAAVRDRRTRNKTSSSVYAKVAPGVVVVQNSGGHGTGVIVGEDGWIVTNSHVVQKVGMDATSGAQAVRCYLGRLHDGVMELDDKPRICRVHKIDSDKDLALLKLVDVDQPLTVVPLAPKGAVAGDDCYAIGHPAAGMLWTLRPGEVAGIGQWPRDMIQSVMARLAASDAQQQQLQKSLESAPKRRVVLSSCGINPGDSGGPIVNGEGEIVGITFAIPKSEASTGISLDKIAYHIHVDDLREFLNERPEKPIVLVPDAWPGGTVSAWADRNEDGKVDSWMFGASASGPVTGFVIDLDQNSGKQFSLDKSTDIGRRHEWDFELAMHRLPIPRAFYDRDNDGVIDYILSDVNGDDMADLALERIDGDWQSVALAPAQQPLLDPTLFKSTELQAAFRSLIAPQQPKPTPAASTP